jgi:predicted O-linked N-acetylglucosamine transferase (SPINDLY family)
LDNFPFGAQTTASDALWAGLPIVTRTGEAMMSRVAASLLTAVGLPELITTNEADYEALVLELATHPDKLKAIRDKLARNRLTTPLFNTEDYATHFQKAYLAMLDA